MFATVRESVCGPKQESRPSSGDIRSWGDSGLACHRVRMTALDPNRSYTWPQTRPQFGSEGQSLAAQASTREPPLPRCPHESSCNRRTGLPSPRSAAMRVPPGIQTHADLRVKIDVSSPRSQFYGAVVPAVVVSPGRWSTDGAREKLTRPRFMPRVGWASSAMAAVRLTQSSTTISAGWPTAIP